jgi:hypothetical protein
VRRAIFFTSETSGGTIGFTGEWVTVRVISSAFSSAIFCPEKMGSR